jgi:hypothetical protein
MAPHNLRRAFRTSPEPLLINWRRGLFRVWLLVSAGWVMGWTIYLIMYSLQGGYSGNRHFVASHIIARTAAGTFHFRGDRLGIPLLPS